MASVSLRGTAIRGLSCAVPRRVIANDFFSDILDAKTIKGIEKMTGVLTRRYVEPGTTASDLCFAAAENLLQKLSWEKDSVDMLVFLTQTPDHPKPGTATDLHGRLGLRSSCAVFDVTLSCAGFVYGLWLCSNFIAASGFKRILFLNGDTSSVNRYGQHSASRSIAQLFGDAGAATALEADASAPDAHYVLGTDGRGFKNLYQPAGGFRAYSTEATRVRTAREDGSFRSEEDSFMDGSEIFKFTVERVPESLNELQKISGSAYAQTDYFLLHQANQFILDHLTRFLKLDPAKVPLSISEYGNTSSASIPLTMTTRISQALTEKTNRLTLAGFGSGYSWAAAHIEMPRLRVADCLEI